MQNQLRQVYLLTDSELVAIYPAKHQRKERKQIEERVEEAFERIGRELWRNAKREAL